jgi:hypothetical protein
MKTFIIIGLVCAAAFGQQAKRDTIEATDKLNINPLAGLRYIDLTTEDAVFTAKGIKKKARAYQYYFRVSGEEDYARVSYFGNNLADYVSPVPKAHGHMKSYMAMKFTNIVLFYGGLITTAVGGALSLSKKELSPVVFVGAALFSSSWIPKYFSYNKIPEAVGAYNAEISEYKEVIP